MKKTFIVSVLLVMNSLLFAQKEVQQFTKNKVNTGRDTIAISNTSKGIRYSMNGEMLPSDKFTSLFSTNAMAQQEFEIVKNYKLYATILTVAGTGFLLYGISDYLAYENDQSYTTSGAQSSMGSYTAPLIIGPGAIAASLPFVLGSKIHLRKAVILYNQSVNTRTS